jgi:hypothetical protein
MTTTAMTKDTRWLLPVLFFLACTAPSRLHAAEPGIRNLNVRGLQIGSTTTIVVDGDDLGTAPRLLLPFPSQVKPKPGSNDKQATFEVNLDGNVQPGYYHLRVVTDGGVSLPIVVGVDRLPQRPLAAAVDQLPAALHGIVNGSAVVETRFPGKAGQRVLIEVEAQRLGSKLRPVLHLYSPKRLQLAWSWPTPALFGDTRLEATLPEDGVYSIGVHDAEYATPAPGFFRLRIGQWSFADQVFPPVIGRGTHTVELLGSPSQVRMNVSASPGAAVIPLHFPGQGMWSGPRPVVSVSSRPEIVVPASTGQVQDLPAGPVGVSGCLVKPFAEDRFRVPVQPASKLRLEVFAERYGSPLNVALVVRNESSGQLARVEESPGTLDPVLEYTVPDKITAIVVGVADAQGRAGPRGIYHLTVDPQPAAAGKTAFQLFASSGRITLASGGRSVVPIVIERRGYQGSVALAAEGLPGGVHLDYAVIPAGADGALVTLHRDGPSGEAVITNWRGRGENGVERAVVVRGHPLERSQPWLATEVAVAPTANKAADFQIDWRGLSAEAGLVPAGKLVLPVKLIRPAVTSIVRLGLVTSQLPPLVNNQPDPNRTLRPEKVVELADKLVEGEFTIVAPPQLNSPVYDVTVQADLLTPDKNTVLATAFAPVRRMPVRMPLLVHLEGSGHLEAKLDAKSGTAFKVKGKVERREGLTGDVVVSLAGLPAGGRANPVTVKMGANEFILDVVLPANIPVGEAKGLTLFGTAAPDPKQPNVRVRSRDLELILVIQPAAP